MPPDDAFLAAILAEPDNDAPRLIYADWLDERGDPRGEFIRVQCQLAQYPAERPLPPELAAHWGGLYPRQEQLWQLHGQGWWDQLPRLRGVRLADQYEYDGEMVGFHRGFLAM